MKKLALTACAVALSVVGTMTTVRAAEEPTTLNGSFVWEQGNTSGDLEAVFTPTGEGAWDVSFHFTFRDKPHTYTGSASGNLTAGDLSGTVLNENKKRTFTFEGSFADGVFNGSHSEVGSERAMSTGTLTLR